MTDENDTPDNDQVAQNDEVGANPEPPADNAAQASDDLNDDQNAATGASEAEADGQPGSKARRNDVNIDALLKVPVALSIEVGRKKMRLDDLLETQEGSVVELDKLLNEPLDILVNGALIAHGVIVLAQDRFGIQITDILSPEERARSL